MDRGGVDLDPASRYNCWALGHQARIRFQQLAHQHHQQLAAIERHPELWPDARPHPRPQTALTKPPFDWEPARTLWADGFAGRPLDHPPNWQDNVWWTFRWTLWAS